MWIVIGKVIGAIVLLMFGTAGISAILGRGGIPDRLRVGIPIDTKTWFWSISLLVLAFCAIGGGIYLAVSAFT
jgi:hypothetical protein